MSADPHHHPDEVLAALADGSRRVILAALRNGPRPVGHIAQKTGLSQQAARSIFAC